MLHIDSDGQGADLVMLHGWGMHSDIWSDWAGLLGRHFRVHRLDLPGHGHSADAGGASLDEWAEAAVASAPADAWWLGWSLGGLVAMNVARLFSSRVRGLVLLSSTPKFVKAADWPCAVEAAVFEQFATQLAEDRERTLTRFLALQVRGAEHSGESLRQLRAHLAMRPPARPRALENGLRLLQESDMRAALADIDTPVYCLFGERDTLVPATLAGRMTTGASKIIAGGGHAAFLSHPDACAQQVADWLLPTAQGVGYAGV